MHVLSIKIVEEVREGPIPYQTFVARKMNASTPIEPGQIIINASVRVEFQY